MYSYLWMSAVYIILMVVLWVLDYYGIGDTDNGGGNNENI